MIGRLFFLALVFPILNPWAAAQNSTQELGQAYQMGMGTVGEVSPDAIGIDPMTYLTTWNFNHLPPGERKRFYRESRLPMGKA